MQGTGFNSQIPKYDNNMSVLKLKILRKIQNSNTYRHVKLSPYRQYYEATEAFENTK